jgi:hypothetical protein
MKKLAIILAAIGVVVIVVVAFGYQVLQALVGKPRLLAVRECIMTPQPLRIDADAIDVHGLPLSQFGYTITVPWTNRLKDFGLGNVTNVVFAGGQRITLLDPRTFPDLRGMIDRFADDQTPGSQSRQEVEAVRRLFGNMGHEEFFRHLLYAHPSQFSAFMGKREAKQLKAFLVMKPTLLMDHSAIYSFTNGERRGFQLGDPERDALCDIFIFDGADIPIHFRVLRTNHSGAVITQRDLVQMIKSFRRFGSKSNGTS